MNSRKTFVSQSAGATALSVLVIILLLGLIVYGSWRYHLYAKEHSVPKDLIEETREAQHKLEPTEFQRYLLGVVLDSISDRKFAAAMAVSREFGQERPTFVLISLLSQVFLKDISKDSLQARLSELESKIEAPSPYQEYLLGRLYYLLGRDFEGYSKSMLKMATARRSKNPFFLKSLSHYHQAFRLSNDPYPLVEKGMVFDIALNNFDSAKICYESIISGFEEGARRFSCYVRYHSDFREFLVSRGRLEDTCKARLSMIFSDEGNLIERDKYSLKGALTYQASTNLVATTWLDSESSIWRLDLATRCEWVELI
jgi:tetratricopeptide (TPR) repeat protein